MPSRHSEIMENQCVYCHMYSVKGEEKKRIELLNKDPKQLKGGHTFEVDKRICLQCHDEPDKLVSEWKKKIEKLIKQLKELMEEKPDKLSNSYKTAKSNYNMVIYDGGTGIHNPRYAEVLLRHGIYSLTTGKAWEK
ncbi:hypothetical protein GF312_11885 [Candidatus Poribacteria bacterium]|nr:hypothetical protein [Candidatus Poribacteria bacterium]